jgi:hypothetical protein
MVGEVDILDPGSRKLGDADAAVEQHPQDRLVSSVIEVLTGRPLE